VAIYNHYVENSIAPFDTAPTSVEDRAAWFETFSDVGPYRLLVAAEGGGVLGCASSGPYRAHQAFAQTVEVGVYIDSEVRATGVGSALYGALLEELRTEGPHLAVAGIALPNDASVALHRKFGFTDVGFFEEYAVKHGNAALKDLTTAVRLNALEDARPAHPRVPEPREKPDLAARVPHVKVGEQLSGAGTAPAGACPHPPVARNCWHWDVDRLDRCEGIEVGWAEVQLLDATSWPDFARLVEKHNGVRGGCWCMAFHAGGVGRAKAAGQNRAETEVRIREGRAHAALAYDGSACVGWCQFGPTEELPRIKRQRAYDQGRRR